MDLLNKFLNRAATESVNGYADGLREDAKDRAEGRGAWDGVRYTCRRCGRDNCLWVEDGECSGCLNDAEMQYERRRAEIEKIPRYRKIAEGWRGQGFDDQAEALLAYVAHLEKGIK